jgi:hypothetical protein
VVHEAELRMAEHLVEDGEALVARQRDLITRLTENGHPTDAAKHVLERLQALLNDKRERLSRVRDPSLRTDTRQAAPQELRPVSADEPAT